VSTADAVAGVLWVGVTLYAVFGGADFGGGFWSLLAGGGNRGKRVRALIDWAIGPVWEANHVWLIFVLVVLWTAFSAAFSAVFSTLFIPLSLAALGIVLRGGGFAFHRLAPGARGRQVSEAIFGLSSLLTPFFMGTVVGAVASGRVPLGNAEGDPLTSWVNAASLLTGALAVAGLLVYRADARYIYDGLTGDALPLVILSAVCGLGVLVILWRGQRRGTRPLAVGAVVAVIWGWGVAQHPYLLPQSLTISDGAGTGTTMDAILIVFVVAVLIVIPALAFLYTLAQRSMLEGEAQAPGPGSEAAKPRS